MIIRTGGECRTLQEEVENTKGALLLDSDRLSYNERILKEHKPELQAMLLSQKRRITVQKETLARLKVRFSLENRITLRDKLVSFLGRFNQYFLLLLCNKTA